MKRILSLLAVFLITACSLCACGLFSSPGSSTIELDQTQLDMVVGDNVELSAGDAVKVSWSSSNDAVAAVHSGMVSAKSAGTAVITASLENGAKAECGVTVSEKLITAVTLSVRSTRIETGKTIQITANYSPADASEHKLSWSSDDEAVAVVDGEGYVTAVSEGSTNIRCTSSNGIEDVCAVTVGASPQAPTSPPTAPAATQPPTEKATEKDGDTPAATKAPAVYSDDFIFPDSSVRMLTDSEVRATLYSLSGESVSGSFAQDAVNEIFARNGYVFKTYYIREYYESKSWYRADPDFSPLDLSETEQYNISLFNKY